MLAILERFFCPNFPSIYSNNKPDKKCKFHLLDFYHVTYSCSTTLQNPP